MTTSPIVPILAARAAKAHKAVIDAFLDAEATAPERAIAFAPSRRFEKRYLASLEAAGAVRPTSDGRLYLDEPALAAHKASRRKRLLSIASLAAAALATIAAAMTMTR